VRPRGVVWFGLRSFWGHLRHLAAAAIATEDIDSRDWMSPDEPGELATRVIEILGGTPNASVVGGIGRDLWIDFIADTGDDVSVSRAMAALVSASYELQEPDDPSKPLLAPRGDILLFGGDTAYPVATTTEITRRVLVPFSEAFARVDDGTERVLLGVPGNHDWYDGLDGFGRMFRRREAPVEGERRSMLTISKHMLEHHAEWAREFVRGGTVTKPDALELPRYTPVQNASYFILPLTPTIHLFGVDRQLKDVDPNQLRFQLGWYRRHPEVCPWILMPDPLYRFGRPSPTGTEMVRALGFDFDTRPHFLLAGDVHHYERTWHGPTLHVIAGGGGAFLHPAPMFEGRQRAEVRWPTASQSRALLGQVPWKIALGRSGFLPHIALGLIFSLGMAIGTRFQDRLGLIVPAPILVTAVTSTIYALIGGIPRNFRRVAALAIAAGLLTAAIPIAASLLVSKLLGSLVIGASPWAQAAITMLIAVFAGAWIFGAYLALLTRLGLEHTQAFTALDHPGFKHFLRMRVRADGSGIDTWCIGLTDPLATGAEPVLVDTFVWRTTRESR
jgi:hypothetical protein